jgi:hypothetical protein
MVGTTAVLGGVMALLLAKGTAACSALQNHPRVLPMVFVLMILFGWAVQLLLVRPKKAAKSPVKEKEG